ncbi:Uma2 family endonuclease [Streptomyces iconiensis]|uniref:Uma2 family endonuclease n=1 Tax=Streptomyces iconiensis TaxID=1384038 RepID=A0ABT7A962_9ACTN|nr:Uma2 family endonuclease [Streptomyces iconiensis]MDJ1137529.1 Uma2 family endonuclease [Streptomyces iconiensis]
MGAVMAVEEPASATEEHWAFPPEAGWTFDQAQELDLPFKWELVDGNIVVRGRAKVWHSWVRDELRDVLKQARTNPYVVSGEQCVMLDEQNVRVPDLIVYDPEGLTLVQAEYVPIANVALAVEVVSLGSRATDRITKPVQYAQAKVPYYWRVELERDEQIAVHEYWLNSDTLSYFPAPSHPVHRRELATDLPFPVKIDLAELTRF